MNLHKDARNGSGGVVFFVKNKFVTDFEVTVLDDSVEGIFLAQVHTQVMRQ